MESSQLKKLSSSLTSERIPILQESRSQLSSWEKSQITQLLVQILDSYNYYSDANSRNEALSTLLKIIEHDNSYLDDVIKYMTPLSTQKIALTDLLTLSNWCNFIQIFCLKSDLPINKDLIMLQGNLLNNCLLICYGSNSRDRRVHKSIISNAKYSISECLKVITTKGQAETLIDSIVKITIDMNDVNVPLTMIGVLASAVHDLLPFDPKLFHHFSGISDIITWFNDKVILGKVLPESYAFNTFNSFFTTIFMTQEWFNQITLTFNKLIVKNSENSLGNLIPKWLKSVDFTNVKLDNEFFNSKFFENLINGLKNSKPQVKLGAFEGLKVIITTINSTCEAPCLEKLSSAAKTNTNTESKQYCFQLISLITLDSFDVKIKLLNDLIPLIKKDTNEISLSYSVKAFINNYFLVDQDDSFNTVINNGLTDKKWNLKKVWFIAIGEYIINHPINDSITTKISSLHQSLVKSFDESCTSPLVVVNNKGIGCSFVTIYLNHLFNNAKDIFQKAFDQTKISIISTKILSKLDNDDDVIWAFHALEALSYNINLTKDPKPVLLGWIYLLTSANIKPNLRLQGLSNFKRAIAASEFPSLFVDYLVKTLQDIDDNDEEIISLDLQLKNFTSMLLPLLSHGITSDYKLMLVANHKSIPVKDNWIGLCQSANININEYVIQRFDSIYNVILEQFTRPHSGQVYQAAISSLGQLAYIVPDLVIPRLVEMFEKELTKENIDIDELSLSIWRHSGSEPFVDVLAKLSKSNQNKSSKNSETDKWEEDLKKELKAKNAKQQPKKLTKEEQSLVNDQLAKESDIRCSVQSHVNALFKNLNIVNELVNVSLSFDTQVSQWYPIVVNKLVGLFPAHKLINNLTESFFIDSFLNLRNLMTSRLDKAYHSLIGVAVLRLYEYSGLPENLTQESLTSLVSRILFRVKILSDQSPLDLITIAYMLPLLTQVLKNGKKVAIKNSKKQVVVSEFVEEDPEEEQLLLSVEIISIHGECFQESTIPRLDILNDLISLMKLPSKSKLAKECFLSVCQNISVNFDETDLKNLFDNLVVPETIIKTTILESLDAEFDLTTALTYSNELWITYHDTDEMTSNLSKTIWEDNDLKVIEEAPYQLVDNFLDHEDSALRLSVAEAVIDALKVYPNTIPDFLEHMFDFYHVKSRPPPPKLDEFGLVIKSTVSDKDFWEIRSTIAVILKLLTPLIDKELLPRIFKFLIDEKALNDKSDVVRQELQDGGIEIIKYHGLENLEQLIPIFESSLSNAGLENYIKESAIIFYGALGRHLQQDDHRVKVVVDRLIKTLDSSSEPVQIAVSKCLSPLVKLFDSNLQQYFDHLFEQLFDNKLSASTRTGAAYGISGLVKGAGIKTLSSFDIIRQLSDAADDKKDPIKRESVSIAFYCLSLSLGKFFEPYVIEILPIILKSLGDSVPEVRAATDKAARTIMRNTTSYGVKKLIPVAISNLDEIQWRSKRGSVELLGSMAYLDPAQLSASLSVIVPEIVGVLNDTHKEVRKSADQSLKRFGEVIRNPEIQQIVPDLIKAIGDPTKYTDDALDKLIKTQFAHYIDGPSLALIIHVIHRGMKDRSASTKRKACQIVGNMAILVDTKDLKPYLGSLISELEISMVDPVPATRSTAARALGSLVEKLGEEHFPDLIPKLLGNLQDETKTGDRLGSAQALSEVICGLGINKLEELLPVVLTNAKSSKGYVKAGFMPLLLYLPVCFGTQFSPYLSQIIPPILGGLAETDEDIRDTALRAGRLIVKNYAKKAIDLLLPELEIGLADLNYRIRLSSVELTGDLLFQVTGISGKSELVEDEQEVSGEVSKSLIAVLGQDRRDRVLSLLFVCRSDVNAMVRNKSVEIWKALVANTPKTVKEILPTLTQIIIKKLSSDDEVEKNIAATTLGEAIRRVGANALGQLLPNLEELMYSNDEGSKEGICVAITELIKSTSTEGLTEYQDIFIRIIRLALTDSSKFVRNSAAHSFEALQNELGKVVIDEIIPNLLNKLDSDDSENALFALQDLMSTKSEVIFPILIPTLLSPPIDSFKVKALASLASVAGSALFKKLSLIINTFVNLIIESNAEGDEESTQLIKSCFDRILLSVNDKNGVIPLMQTVLSLTKHEDHRRRAVVYERLGTFFEHTTLDYSLYTADMVSQFILSLGDKSIDVVKGTFEALNSLVKNQPRESLDKLVKPAEQSLTITGIKGEELEAFKLPKGPNCILPIFSHGLMYGSLELKELSAIAIGDIIEKTPAANLRPFATTITGPLIRVVGEKVNSSIKSAILFALNSLLIKIPQFLRPFIPQLQRTFVRSLSDQTNDELRARAVTALGTLIKFQPRIDSLVVELISGCKNTDSEDIKLTMLKALLEIINKSGDKLNENSKTLIMTLIEEEILVVKGKSSIQYAKLIGSLSKVLTVEEADNIISTKVLGPEQEQKFSILAINAFLRESSDKVFATKLERVCQFILESCDSKDVYISAHSCLAIGKLLLSMDESKGNVITPELLNQLVNKLCELIVEPVSNSPDTRRLALVVMRTLGRYKFQQVIEPNLDLIIPTVFLNIRDPIIPIKLASEKCYLTVLNLVETDKIANEWMNRQSGDIECQGRKIVLRSITEYNRRVATRLASVERERIEQGGDEETLYSDRIEDENEVWSVGE